MYKAISTGINSFFITDVIDHYKSCKLMKYLYQNGLTGHLTFFLKLVPYDEIEVNDIQGFMEKLRNSTQPCHENISVIYKKK